MDERYRETLKIWDQLAGRYQDSSTLDISNASYDFLIQSCQNQSPSILKLGSQPADMSKYLCGKLPSARLLVAELSSKMGSSVDWNIQDYKTKEMHIKQFSELEGEFDVVIIGFGIPYLDEDDIAHLLSMANRKLRTHGLLYLTYQQNHTKELDLLRQDQLISNAFIFNLIDQVGLSRLKHFQVLQTTEGMLIAKHEVLITRKLDGEKEY
ncbi:MAG: class I SAM-dependent methyltransferase [Saprospiraceae bacterium]|nr:class I SAM-dependent methyltransferase [Saprospiraceae bacterium]